MPRTVPLILIVDPDAATLAVCEELLQRVGYATVACQAAREAQRHIDMDRPDLLLVELDLEGIVNLRTARIVWYHWSHDNSTILALLHGLSLSRGDY